MRDIIIEELRDRLSLGTTELDGYINLPLTNGVANTSRLDDNTCQNTFACNAKELRKFLKDKGY